MAEVVGVAVDEHACLVVLQWDGVVECGRVGIGGVAEHSGVGDLDISADLAVIASVFHTSPTIISRAEDVPQSRK